MEKLKLPRLWYLSGINRLKTISQLAMAIILLLTCSCAPKVSITSQPDQHLRTLILVPPSYDANVSRERINYINDAFARKLSASGFNVINAQAVSTFCTEGDCSNPAQLATKSNSDAAAQIIVTSTNSANVLAGYFQSITGKGLFIDRSGKELASVDYTQTERGGLLFNSGQVLQGIQSTVDKFGDNSFNNLADKFLDTIVAKLPVPKGTLEITDLKIGKSSVSALGSGRYLACVDSSNASAANLRSGKSVIPLRSAGPGKFCGVFLLDPGELSDSKSLWTFNVLGRYGESKTVTPEQTPISDCQTAEAVKNRVKKSFLHQKIVAAEILTFLSLKQNSLLAPIP